MEHIKIAFLGIGNGLMNDKGIYHSCMMVCHGADRLFIDCGSDFPHALRDAKLSHRDVKNLYISHIHSDHAGGLEWLGFIKHFDPEDACKPELFAVSEVRKNLAAMLLPSMAPSIEGMNEHGLQSCFSMREPNGGFSIGSMRCTTIKTIHVNNGYGKLYSYGLFITVGNKHLLFTSDTQFNPDVFMPYYEKATLILHDCSTGPQPYGAHAHISQLAELPSDIKAKMLLYHCGPGMKPDAHTLGFKGYARQRESVTVR